MNYRPDVIILDSYQLFGYGIQTLLTTIGPKFRSLFAVSLNDALENLAREPSIRLAFVDLAAPGVDGPASIRLLRARFQELKVIAICSVEIRDVVFDCLAQGAYGCILRSQPGTEILNAVRVVMSGGVYVPASVVETLAHAAEVLKPVEADQRAVAGQEIANKQDQPATTQLSKQQQAVLELLIRGLSNKAIARELQLAEGTVKVHVNGVFKALKVNSRVQAVVRSVEFHKSIPRAKPVFDTFTDTLGGDPDAPVAIN